ncbi:MAG: FRG domain-containing protein [Dehalococcoidales bacterium]|jgi:hypothetical protein
MVRYPYFKQKCTSLNDFLGKVDSLVNNGWMFRGQKNGSWELKTSFERACGQFNVPQNKKRQVETNMIREFQRRVHQYERFSPNDDDECLALMQHHGAPTRLLDFTYSPHVAAYFAFEAAEPKSKVAIWAINYEWCKEHLKEIANHLYKEYKSYRDIRNGKDFKLIFRTRRFEKFLLSVTPLRMNERLSYQRGVFLCPGDIETNIMDTLTNYTEMKDLKNKVRKYIIPTGENNEVTIEALQALDIMNISRITLFPGLDGFAQSFATRIHPLFLRQGGH